METTLVKSLHSTVFKHENWTGISLLKLIFCRLKKKVDGANFEDKLRAYEYSNWEKLKNIKTFLWKISSTVLLPYLMTEEEDEEEEVEEDDWLSSEERTMTLPGLSEPPSLSL